MFKLDWCSGSVNTRDYQSGWICVANKSKDINLNIFHIVTRINESKA